MDISAVILLPVSDFAARLLIPFNLFLIWIFRLTSTVISFKDDNLITLISWFCEACQIVSFASNFIAFLRIGLLNRKL